MTWGRRYVTVFGAGPGVDSIQDPDGTRVRFGQDPARSYRVSSRTNRLGVRTTFGYDGGGKLSSARMTLEDDTSIVSAFLAAEGRGVASSVLSSQAYTLLDGPRTDVADHTYLWLTRWGAPRRIRDAGGGETIISRADDRFPALPTQVAAPGGLTTRAAYDERGRVVQSTVENPLGDGRNAVTTYAYDDRWDSPDTVRVFAESGSVRTPLSAPSFFAYDPASGNPLWRQVGEDSIRRVRFRYYPAGHPHAGQLRAVQEPAAAARDSLVYDARGNLWMTVSPTGYLTLHYRDALGRDTLTVTPTRAEAATRVDSLLASGVRQHTTRDVMDRAVHTRSIGPARTHTAGGSSFVPAPTPEERVEVATLYDLEGAPLRVARWTSPDPAGIDTLVTTYQYDAAGRRVRQTEGLQTERFAYDAAGNDTLWITGRGYSIRSRYDALGRLVLRAVPAVFYEKTCHVLNVGAAPDSGGGGKDLQEPTAGQPGDLEGETTASCSRYPEFPSDASGGLLIPADSTVYRYDGLGNLVYAENADAIVERGYYPNGLLRDDMMKMRTYTGTDFTRHVYPASYRYDLAGRLTALHHPAVLAGASSVDTFAYSPATGALESARDRVGTRFDFRYDAAGRTTSVHQSYNGAAAVVDSTWYDAEGRHIGRREYQAVYPGGTLHEETYAYDARGKLLTVADLAGGAAHHQWYSGLGMLAATHWTNVQNPAYEAEEFRTDGLGNVYARRSGAAGPRSTYPWFNSEHQARSGRVTSITTQAPQTPYDAYAPEETSRTFDGSGNLDWSVRRVYSQHDPGYVGRHTRTRSFYSADERLRYFQKNDVGVSGTTYSAVERSGVWEEYRYDPFGRRIMVRSIQSSLCTESERVHCVSHITRYVWAGDQVLWELRALGGMGVDLEQTGGTGDELGWVSYFHAKGIDRPLTITKYGQGTVVPHQNWRGQYSLGTFQNGQRSDYAYRTGSAYLNVPWPALRTTAWHQETKEPVIRAWWGDLVDGMRDRSGQMYMRNRYYDPQTGQFTQTDPIGLRGGLNAYGFAAGDPVSYADPFGLCAAHLVQRAPADFPERVCPGGLTHGEYYAKEDGSPMQVRRDTIYFARTTTSEPEWIGCGEPRITHTQRQIHVRTTWPLVLWDRLTWDVYKNVPSPATREKWGFSRGNFGFYAGRLLGFGPDDVIVPAVAIVNCDNGMAHFFASNHLPHLYGVLSP